MNTYANKSNAKRALKKISTAAFEAAEELLTKTEDGKWQFDATVAEQAGREEQLDETEQHLMAACGHVNCPGCGIHLDNGLLNIQDHYNDLKSGQIVMGAGETKRLLEEMENNPQKEHECMACGHQFGNDLNLKPGTGIKIEKNRPEQNGVVRPSIGGVCREIWDFCAELYASTGNVPKPKDVKAEAEKRGWNMNNAVIELYQWRKFEGIRGRQ